MTLREAAEQRERATLSPRTAFSDAATRARDETPCAVRTAFQRDRDRIIHCEAFRRLKHKTQVFLSPRGDHYRTRLTHTLEVSQIARTIAGALLLNENLTEAIALGHDLGHTPFGHAGERALGEVMPGGFRHYEQSRRVCEVLEKDGAGLNLTRETLEGIVRHTHGAQASTLEGRIVRLSDKIAYINHDIEDAIIAGVLTEEDIPKALRDALGRTKSVRINTLVRSCIQSSVADIALAPGIQAPFEELHAFMFSHVYTNPVCKSEEGKAVALLQRLWTYFCEYPDLLPSGYIRIAETEGTQRAVCDYIAGMTDRYAVTLFNDLFVPKDWGVF
ncbi:MAG: deoxyguanosinetriphosphate triphosphohydrolase [Oscillospiraceae bacterium]|jgi:dGTPase|nr:deoxyguanosinetriphosphate triphosphohydrolase [Oscillospiraceae bacterium]